MLILYALVLNLCILFANSQSQDDFNKETNGTLYLNDEVSYGQICYTNLGCFDCNRGPWKSRFRRCLLPQSPEIIQTGFYFSSRNFQGAYRIKLTTEPKIQLQNIDFDSRRWLVLITHGFKSSANVEWIRQLEEALLISDDYNIVTVDWAKGNVGINYFQAASNARVVGTVIAKFLNELILRGYANPGKIHLIGQSLGAHVMSYVGANVNNIARITGLDPAQPGFEFEDPIVRLDPTDARFVEVLHTHASPFWPSLGLGMIRSVGHVDFFINGGVKQPGCKRFIDHNITSFIQEPLASFTCSHNRAQQYYIEALRSFCSFWAYPWSINTPEPNENEICTPDKCQELGKFSYYLPARGSFFIRTNIHPPFCKWNAKNTRSMARFLMLLIQKPSSGVQVMSTHVRSLLNFMIE